MNLLELRNRIQAELDKGNRNHIPVFIMDTDGFVRPINNMGVGCLETIDQNDMDLTNDEYDWGKSGLDTTMKEGDEFIPIYME